MTEEQKVKVYNDIIDEVEKKDNLQYCKDDRYLFVTGYLIACLKIKELEMTMQDFWDIQYEVMTCNYK